MAWYESPDVETIIRRAEDYRRTYYRDFGTSPYTFLLTPDESRIINARYGGTPTHLYGMEVQHPRLTPRPLYPARIWIHYHIPPMRVTLVEPRIPIMLDDPRVCETRVPPSMNMRQLLCPCGEILWDLTTPYRPDGGSSLYRNVPQVIADEVSDEVWLDAVETMIHDVKARRSKA